MSKLGKPTKLIQEIIRLILEKYWFEFEQLKKASII
jgi:hypothetical protein